MKKLALLLALAPAGCYDGTLEPEPCYDVTEYDADGNVVRTYRTLGEEESELPDGVAVRIHWPCGR